MSNIQELSEVALELITYAGIAKSNYILALNEYKKGNVIEYENKIAQGDTNFVLAHNCHKKTLLDEIEMLQPNVSLLLVHAEDQLMNAESTKLMITEIVELYKLIIIK